MYHLCTIYVPITYQFRIKLHEDIKTYMEIKSLATPVSMGIYPFLWRNMDFYETRSQITDYMTLQERMDYYNGKGRAFQQEIEKRL